MLTFNEPVTPVRIACIALILAGIIGLKAFASLFEVAWAVGLIAGQQSKRVKLARARSA